MTRSFDKLQSIFLAACELPRDERAAFVEAKCGDDKTLVAQILQMLAADAATDGQLNSDARLGTFRSAIETDLQDDVYGSYRLVRPIGAGGFGAVYVAAQDDPSREVALKVLLPGRDSEEMLARFEFERQALAQLEHPGLARIFDAGTSRRGRPFFVMELVNGPPLTTYCDAQELDLESRLRLMQQVCVAVNHAHNKGVIHRDLKPSNVLVAELEDGPQVRVIDFGIAKPVDADLTQTSGFVGTPAYMSPEQIEGRAVDTRTDVYSLGVMLYELLCGSTPFDPECGFAALQEALVTRDPPRPSDACLQRDDASTLRGFTSSESLSRRLRGDLDWIAMKALAREADRRYNSPLELSEDIGRALGNEPVVAGPPSARYRIGKFVRRNRLPVVASIAAVVALVSLVVVGVVLSVAAERSRATDRTVEAYRLTASIVTASKDGDWQAVIDGVDRALQYVEAPEDIELLLAKAEAHEMLTDVHGARAIVDELVKRDDLDRLRARVLLRKGDTSLTNASEAREWIEQVIELTNEDRTLLDPADLEYARALSSGSSQTCVTHLLAAVDADPSHHRARMMLGLTLTFLGRFEEAIDQFDALRALTPDSPIPDAATAMVHTLTNNREARSLSMLRVRLRMHPSDADALEAIFTVLDRGIETLSPSSSRASILPIWADLLRLTKEMQRDQDGREARIADTIRLPPYLYAAFGDMIGDRMSVLTVLNRLRDPAVTSSAVERHPEGFLMLLHGVALHRQHRAVEAARSYEAALGTPAIVPRVTVLAGIKASELYKEITVRGTPMREDALRVVRETLAHPHVVPTDHRRLWDVALALEDFECARAVLRNWRELDPADTALDGLRARTELEARDYAGAIRWAEVALNSFPGNESLIQIREEAVAGRQAAARELLGVE